MRLDRRLIGLVAIVVIAVSSFALTGFAREGDFRRVTLTDVDTKKNEKGNWVLVVTGECPRVPAGTKMNLHLTWRSTIVESFKITTAGASFKESFEIKKATAVAGDEINLRTAIVKKEQKKDIRKKMEGDEIAFPPGMAKYVDHHFGNAFIIGTSEEVAARKSKAKEFFSKRIEVLLEVDQAVSEKFDDVDNGKVFTSKAGEFMAEEWHAWFEGEVVEPLVKLQQEVEKKFENLEFRPYLNTLADLKELSTAVARRALKKQEQVFKAADRQLADKYKHKSGKEGELDSHTQTRRSPKGSYLNQILNRIRESVGITAPKKEDEGQPERDREKK